ncbi:MAG: hypothetical protein Q4C95_08335 [Planctomycetia bacterium]|nr:hypothetical protein [Planctomycetia bacterium]
MTLKKGSLTLWNLENIQSVYSLAGNWKSLSFSQDRKTFVLETVGGLDCYETLSGKLLGSLPIKSNKIEATAFSPDGQKLGVQNKNSLSVYDLQNGQLICNMMIEQSLIGNRILWTDNQHILISSVLYDLEKEIPLCRYTMPLKQKGVACYQGKIWSIFDHYESGKRKSFLFGAVLPHQSAIDFAKKLDVANDFWVYPGTKVRLRLELNGFADEKETETILQKRLKEMQIEVDSKAKVEILLSYNDTKKEEEISYSQSDSLFPLPVISPLRQRELGKMKLKVFEQKIAFSVDQKTIWDFKEATTGPQVVEYDPDKKIEDIFREHNKPNPDFIKYVPIPHYLPKKGKTFNALMNATITVDGIIDSLQQ